MSIVVVGTVAFDTVEAPWGCAERAIGGSATYFSLAASRFTPVKLVAVVGEDFCAEHRAILEDRGVDLEGLVTERGGKTFFWKGRYGEDPNDRENIVTDLNCFERFSPRLAAREKYVAEPPIARSTLPHGASMESNATVPTTTMLIRALSTGGAPESRGRGCSHYIFSGAETPSTRSDSASTMRVASASMRRASLRRRLLETIRQTW